MSVPEKKPAPAGQQATELAASLDAAADDLEHNGPVPPAEVRGTLLTLYAELCRSPVLVLDCPHG
ncbi:MAG: hypothetical protein M3Y41_03370 [Pseudomonadota bacterium]|nr:hypothetical protein [Pseudomonadota bacterium]